MERNSNNVFELFEYILRRRSIEALNPRTAGCSQWSIPLFPRSTRQRQTVVTSPIKYLSKKHIIRGTLNSSGRMYWIPSPVVFRIFSLNLGAFWEQILAIERWGFIILILFISTGLSVSFWLLQSWILYWELFVLCAPAPASGSLADPNFIILHKTAEFDGMRLLFSAAIEKKDIILLSRWTYRSMAPSFVWNTFAC